MEQIQSLTEMLGDGSQNYQMKLALMVIQGEVSTDANVLHDVWIAHDDWCGSFKGKRCNCDPDITVTERREGKLQ